MIADIHLTVVGDTMTMQVTSTEGDEERNAPEVVLSPFWTATLKNALKHAMAETYVAATES